MSKSNNVLNRILLLGFLVSIMGTMAMGSTVAYWRFDDAGDPNIEAGINNGSGGTVEAGVGLPDSDGQSVWRKAAHDWSGNGNHLTTWDYSWAGLYWDDDVPDSTVPKLGYSNTYSIANGGSYPAAMTWSEESAPTGTDLETWQPSQWTIEASFETNYIYGNYTFVGRDDIDVSTATGWTTNASLYFAVRWGGYLDIQYTDAAGYSHVASSSTGSISTNTWYNVAATSDGSTLKLYINGMLVASTDITASGTTDARMALSSNSGGDWQAGTWTLGRGLWNGGHTDRFYGHIDEVRISNKALTQDEFLFPIPAVSVSGTVVPTDLGDTGLPWVATLDYDQAPPLGSEEGGSVWSNGAFYGDAQGEYSLRVLLDEMMDRDVQLGELDTLSYYTNMDSNGTSDWQLQIVTDSHTFVFATDESADDGWDLWEISGNPLASIDGVAASDYLADVMSTYATEVIQYVQIDANSATCSYLDAVTITLTNDSEVTLDLEEMRVPTCCTHAAVDVGTTFATFAGAVVDGGGKVCDFRFHYTPEGGPTLTTPWQAVNGDDAIFLTVEDLLDDTTYTVQLEIANGAGSDLGVERSFTTMQLPQVLISSSSGGSVVDPAEGLIKLVDQGDVLDVNAVADDGYVFSQWAGTAVDEGLVAEPNAAVTSVEVYQALTLKALFVPIPKIVWVTESQDADEDGVRDDVAWVELLEAEGYVVDVQPDRYLTMGDDKDVNDANDYVGELNDATLVIISRSASSGSYATDANEIANWNSVVSPIICLSAYHVRNSRLNWVDSSSAVSDNTISYMTVDDTDHTIFDGLDVSGQLVDLVDLTMYGDGYQGTTFVDAPDMTNATVLGKHLTMQYPWIAEWDAGVETYPGSGMITGGKRMMFMAGTQESDGIPQGDLNLTADGQTIFLNAVSYMMASDPVPTDEIFIKHLYTFEDGTADDLVGDADGTLVGDAYVADGAMITVDSDDWMEMDGSEIAINTYSELTVEMWYTPSEGANTGYTMLAYLGDSSSNYGTDGFFITSARGDDVSRAAISCGSTSPWGDETGVNGTEYDDGQLHHMVSTIDDTTITLYIDGEFIGSSDLVDDNQLCNLSNNYAYLAKGGYTADPEWIGSIHKFTIYNKALSDMEVFFLYLQGE